MVSQLPAQPAYTTLPDLLADGLDVVFIGINPSLYSVQRGHYFARSTNRFWPALSRSRLSERARHALGVATLGPEHDAALLPHGLGFTDVVKRPTRNVSELGPGELGRCAPKLLARLERYDIRVACFQGLTGYRPFLRYALGKPLGRRGLDPELGAQTERLGSTYLFVVPSPSPANFHFTPADQVAWYDRLAAFLDALG